MDRRYLSLVVSLAVGCGAAVALLAGLGSRPAAEARTITVDAANDWLTTFPTPPADNGHVMRDGAYEGEFIWTDAAGDERTDFNSPDARVDIVQMRATADLTQVYFLFQMNNIDLATGDGALQAQIAVDADRVSGSGEADLAGFADTQVNAGAEWEWLFLTRFGSNNPDLIRWGPGGFTGPSYIGATSISTSSELVEISFPWTAIGYSAPPTVPVRFTVATFRDDASDGTWDIGGPSVSDVLDAVTSQAGNTWNEVGDGALDYFFDLYFEPDGDPTSPLQISEVYFDTPTPEASNEFIEIHNPAQYLAYLDGMLLTDETSASSNEGVYQFPGTALTGTTYVVASGDSVVVARDAVNYGGDEVFPDHYWADWETAFGPDNPAVPNLTRVAGSSADLALANAGDNLVLRDGSLITSTAVSMTVVDGVNWVSWGSEAAPADTQIADGDIAGGDPTANEGFSLQRDPRRVNPDTHHSDADFEPDDAPTPGFAKGLIDHAIYTGGPSGVLPGQIYNYYLYWQIAGKAAPSTLITDVLPSGVSLITYTSSYAAVTVDASNAPTLTFALGAIPTSTIGKITATVQLAAGVAFGTVLTQAASIGSSSPVTEGITTNNTAVLTSTVQEPTPTVTRIREIQGLGHLSPLSGTVVANVPGIVIAKRSNSFYMQDPGPDGDDGTSEAIVIFTGAAPPVTVGDAVMVDGTVTEFYPGGYATGNLPTTELTSPSIRVLSSGNPLPAPIVIGINGRIPPGAVIDGDSPTTIDVETDGTFDPVNDGIDFYESLEAMRVQVDNAVAVGPTTGFGEIPVVGDYEAGLRTPRGGLVVRSNDYNPERIILDDAILGSSAMPTVTVNTPFTSPIVGVVDYSFGSFKLLVTHPMTAVPGGLNLETTAAPASHQLGVASFNVFNLDPNDPPARFAALADQIVNRLRSPDIIGLQEIQDNNGAISDTVVSASQTYSMLISAIQVAGGPVYQYRDIDPQPRQDGGEPGGNVRVGFLFRTDRGLAFVDRPGGDATTGVTVTMGAAGVELSLSPGRIAPTHNAWVDTPKPLAGEFVFNGHKLFVVVGHLKSKSGDSPLFGRYQPPVRSTETQRSQQAQVVNDFVDSLLALDPTAEVIVLGDMNDFPFSSPLAALEGGVLTNLVTTLPADEQYSLIFDGNSQALDHILVSDSLLQAAEVDIVHVNAEFYYPSASRPSDHDPVISRFTLNPADFYKLYLPLMARSQ